MKFDVKKANIETTKAETLVLFTTKDRKVLWKPWKNSLSQEAVQFIEKDKGFTGKEKSVKFFRWIRESSPANVLLVGLGDAKDLDTESFRSAAAVVFKTLKAEKQSKVVLPIDDLSTQKIKNDALVQALVEGATLASYDFNELKEKPKEAPKEISITLTTEKTTPATLKKAVEKGQILGESTNFARRLGDLPGNLMTPTNMLKETQKAAKGTTLKITAWDRARIEKEKMGCFLSVALGSEEPPKFIILEYKGGKAKDKPACFVGKGLTFDSGGISIKPSSGMEEMKYDMCGGAAVLGTMIAIARLKLKINVIAFVPATENMVTGKPNKPGDIRTARNGKTVEVNNTDAEGRLILSDSLVYASEQKPKWIVDAATLTGAMVVALGNVHSGYYTTSDALSKKIEAAATVTGEKVWRMPVTKEHSEDMKGTYADLSNLSSNRGAGSATAAAFLKNFVPESLSYAHFDIAGTAWNAGNRLTYNPKKGATGAIVRTFVQLAEKG